MGLSGLTAELGRFVSEIEFSDLPMRSVEVMRLGIADCIAVMIAGAKERAVAMVATTASDQTGPDACPLFPSGRLVSAESAALINGVAAHVLDYDDHAMYAHVSAVLVPAILAEGAVQGSSGKDLLAAFAAGFELWALLHELEPAHLQDKGFHPTAIFGTLATAAACARLGRLTAAQSAQAIGIAASLAAGIVANHGSMTKALHVGRAAQNGVFAARIAKAGYTASPDVLEHKVGFLHAFFSSKREYPSESWQLGTRWRIPGVGVDIKRYPIAYLTHRSIDAMIDLVVEHNVMPDMVQEVQLRTGPSQLTLMRNWHPKSALEAKFSLQFALAAALVSRHVGLAELTDDFVRRPDVAALIEKIQCLPNDEGHSDTPLKTPEHITIVLKSGQVLKASAGLYPKGNAQRPLSDAEFRNKFIACATMGIPKDKAERLLDSLMRLEELASVAELSALMVNQ